MRWRNTLYALANALTPVLSVALVFLFVSGHYALAWGCGLAIIVCAEGRVQLGQRLPRTPLFWIHLSSAMPFFVALTALAFFARLSWIEVVTACFGLVAFGSGAILWYRGASRRLPASRMLELPPGNPQLRPSRSGV